MTATVDEFVAFLTARLVVDYQRVVLRSWFGPVPDPCGGNVPGGSGCSCDPGF